MYSNKHKEIQDNFDFQKIFFIRDNVYSDIEKCRDADILLCSCYCWNWEITCLLAKEVKKINPQCIIIFGGPEVPDVHINFFEEHFYVDIIVHGEGEVVLHNLLMGYIDYIICGHPVDVPGCEVKSKKFIPQDRMTNLDEIPSTYSDEMWNYVDKNTNYKFIASWETNRGCPFQCTFCDWGSATKTKIRNFSEERLYKEIEWFGKNEIIYVDVCDGNFGIFPERDYKLACKLNEVKKATGFPSKLGLTWVKTSSEKIIPMAKKLADAELLRAISLSVQTFDPNTLKVIKRANIKFSSFKDLVTKFDSEGLQSYTELIMGLPGETVATYKRNWEILAAIYPLPSVLTWNCSVFNNAPMNDEEYKRTYGIKTFKSPVFLQHSSNRKDIIPEYERMVRSTSSLSEDDMIEVYTYNWMMLVFHAFGIMELLAHYFKNALNIDDFYDRLLEYCKTQPSLFKDEYDKAVLHATKGYAGGGWDHYDPKIGDISWPMEEASWLRLVQDRTILKQEIIKFLNYLNCFNKGIVDYQLDHISFPPESGDKIQWGYETIWFGRRAQKFKKKAINEF
jgi:radical SAM superfamily enzyme YgiQ (UPF0313 family)